MIYMGAVMFLKWLYWFQFELGSTLNVKNDSPFVYFNVKLLYSR